jgi:hypothetical protein
MPRAKGSVKTGGRKKGTKNKTSAELKQWVLQFVSANTERLNYTFSKLDRETQWAILTKMMSFVIPKKEEVNFDQKAFESWNQAMKKIDNLTQ